MKATKYMSSAHFLEFIKVGIAAGESKAIAEQTKKTAKTPQEKDWAKRLAIAATHLGKVTDERMACLDPDQAKTVDRRWKNSEVRMYTSDQMRLEDALPEAREPVTISYDDWCRLGEMALLHCDMCPQGEYVKNCEYRKTYHRVGIPVARESVQEGECEFCMDNHMQIILPHGQTDRDHRVRDMVQMYYKNAELADEVKRNAENDKREFL